MPNPSPIDTYSVSPLIFLTRCGVRNSPKAPLPHRNKLRVSSEIEALKLPAAMARIGMCEISSMSFSEFYWVRVPSPSCPCPFSPAL